MKLGSRMPSKKDLRKKMGWTNAKEVKLIATAGQVKQMEESDKQKER